MSVRVMAEVWDSAIEGASAAHVMAILANSADDDGMNCFPGTRLIARRARLSERQVKRVIQELEASGYLKIALRGAGAGRFSEYHLNVSRLHDEAEQTRAEQREKRCHGVTFLQRRKVTSARPKGDICAGKGDICDTPLFVLSVSDPSCESTPPYPPSLPREGALAIAIESAVERVCAARAISARRKRRVIREAVVQAAETGSEPVAVAEEMIAALEKKARLAHVLRPLSLEKFIGSGMWRDEREWPVDREAQRAQRLQAEARAGSVQ